MFAKSSWPFCVPTLNAPLYCHRSVRLLHKTSARFAARHPEAMGNKKGQTEAALILPAPPFASTTPIVDTHTHLVSTFESYRNKYKTGQFETTFDFVRGVYAPGEGRPPVQCIVDVWCEAPVQRTWREIADSAIDEANRRDKWGGIDYWFVMGAFQRHR